MSEEEEAISQERQVDAEPDVEEDRGEEDELEEETEEESEERESERVEEREDDMASKRTLGRGRSKPKRTSHRRKARSRRTR